MLQHAIYEALQRFGEKGMRKDSAATRDWTPVEMMKLLRLDPAVAAHPLATEEDCKGNTFFFKETRKAVDGLFGVTQQAGGSKKGNAERRSHLNVTQPAQLLWKDLQVCGRPRNTLFAPPPLFSLPRRPVSPRKRRQRGLWQVPDELFDEYIKTKTSSASSGQVPHRRFRSPPSTLSHFCRFSTPPPPSKVSPRLHIIQAHPFPLRTTLLLSLFLKSSADHGRVTLDRRAPDQAGVCVARRTATAARKIPLHFHPSTVAPNAKPRPLRAHSFSARFALHGPSPARG